MPITTNPFYAIESFIVEKLLSKKITPFLYILYTIIALYIVRDDIGKISPFTYLSFIGFGIALLIVGIWGIRDKMGYAYSIQVTKRQAHYGGYFYLLGSIAVLFLLYYRQYIFG